MQTKQWWKSKTIWLNIVSALLELAQLLTGTNWIPPGTLTLIVNFLNIVLRRITSEAVTFTAPKPSA